MPVYNHFYFIDKKFHHGALLSRGPILNVEISVPTSLARIWNKQMLTIPSSRTGIALLDTGASRTCVDRDAIKSLSIPSIGIERVYTPQGSEEQNKYPVRVSFPSTPLPSVEFGSAYGATLKEQGIIALIGRDLLTHFVFTYNGPGGFITLAY